MSLEPYHAICFPNSDFMIPRLILMLLSSSSSNSLRRPVPLQEGPLGCLLVYSIAAEDCEAMLLFVSSKENRLLNELFLYVLEDIHTCQGPAKPKDASGAGALALPPRPPTALRPPPVALELETLGGSQNGGALGCLGTRHPRIQEFSPLL
jgi:hypothetical protein